jgi:transcription-repair coupling factor (superfamily II helicase)
MVREGGGRVGLNPERPNIMILRTGSIGLREKSEFIKDRLSQLLA